MARAQYIPTDTLFGNQWYLLNTGQTGFGPGNLDLNATYVWPDYTGAGVTVAIYDNGVDYNHPDLKGNYDAALSAIVNGSPSDAHPLNASQVGGITGFNSINAHGTGLAGVAAAENNGVGTVGVAFDSTIVGVYAPMPNFISQPASELLQAMQQLHNYDVAVFANGANNWRDTPTNGTYADLYAGIQDAADHGRGDLGTILVNATHNQGPGFGGIDANSSQFDDSRYFIHVGAVLDTGDVAPYVTRGTTMLVSGLSGASPEGSIRNVWTTDISGADGTSPGDYNSEGGTSTTSPQVAGIAALMLQADPDLGWRDVQQILAASARHTGSDIGAASLHPGETQAWVFNGADNWNGGGDHYSRDYGYGVADALGAVRLAETWLIGAPASTSANEATVVSAGVTSSAPIPDNNGNSVTLQFNVTGNISIEDVQLRLGFNHPRVQDLKITLISPDGTSSDLFDPVSSEAGTGNSITGAGAGWRFTDQEFRGELSAGTWTAIVTDTTSGNSGFLTGTSFVTFFGSADTSDDRYVYTNEFHTYTDQNARDTLTDTDGGTDTINAAAVTADSHIDLHQIAVSTIDGHSLTIAAGTDIENAVGGDGNDTLIGNDLANTLYAERGDDIIGGNGGDDTIDGGAGNDLLGGDDGNDTISGGAGNDTVWGGAGDDHVSGGAGDDVIVGMDGNDTIQADDGNDIVNGGAGADVIAGGAGNDVLGGGADNDVMTGDDGDDSIWGEDGNDVANGGIGNDVVAGGAGDDQLGGGPGDDIVVGDDGNDTLWGEDGNDKMNGGAGNDVLLGGAGDDQLGGSTGDDQISGNDGNDTLWGEDGNDALNGGTGDDILLGGAGIDTFTFTAGDGADTIVDFNPAQDRIWFSATDLHSFADVQSHATFNAAAGATTITYSGGSITLSGVALTQLGAGDFLFA